MSDDPKPDAQPGVEEARAAFEGAPEQAAERSEPYERTLTAARRAMDKYAEALAELAK